MSPEMPQFIDTESFLPELIPAENFPHPFYAKIAEAYWSVSDDPDRAELTDQFLPVAYSLNPKELFELAMLMRNDFPPVENDLNERQHIWGREPDQLAVDEDGNVSAINDNEHATIGHVNQVISFIKHNYISPEDTSKSLVALWLEEALVERIMAGFEKYNGFDIAMELSRALDLEKNRRFKLPKKSLDRNLSAD